MNKQKILAATLGTCLMLPVLANAQMDNSTGNSVAPGASTASPATGNTMAPSTSTTTTGAMTGNTTGTMSAASSNAVSSTDRNFVMMAAQGGMTEVNTSKIAKRKSSSTDVKTFAQHMIDDHAKANDQLKSVARKLNISVPKSLDAAHKAEVAQLKSASKSDFDQKYIAIQDKEHNDAVNAFQQEADAGTNTTLKNFAAQTLPVLQGHLNEVKKLESNMPPAATTGTSNTSQ